MKTLTEYKAELFLEKKGFKIVERKLCKSLQEAIKFSQNKYPVVLKASSNKLLHKGDKVKLNTTKDNIKKHYKELKSKTILVQKQIQGIELILGLKKDPTFGHIILAGTGGTLTEVIKDTTIKKTPINKKQAKEMLKNLKIYNKLTNLNKIINIIIKLSKLPKKHKDIKELDINPLMVNKKQALIVDVRIIFD